MKFVIRKLTYDQMNKDALRLVKKTMTPEVYKMAKDSFVDKDAMSYRRLWGAFCGNKLAGFGGLFKQSKSKKSIWMSYFAVDPKIQRQGLGGILLDGLLMVCKKEKYQRLFVETYSGDAWQSARNFYESHSFRFAGYLKNYLDDNSDAIYYCKDVL